MVKKVSASGQLSAICRLSSNKSASLAGTHQAPEGCSLFLIDAIISLRDGVDPFFLFQGTLRSAAGGPRRAISLFSAQSEALSSVPTGPRSPDQPLTLYIAYDQPTPALKRRRLDAAPFRFSLRAEADDSLLGCSSGLAGEILVDEALKLAVWGGDLALAFPDVDALRQFAGALRGVATRRVRLDCHPCAALLHQQRRGGGGLSPRLHPAAAPAPAATPVVSATASGSLTGVGATVPPSRGDLDAASDADSPPPETRGA